MMTFKDLKIGDYFRFPGTKIIYIKCLDMYYRRVGGKKNQMWHNDGESFVIKMVAFMDIPKDHYFREDGVVYLKLDTNTAIAKYSTRTRRFSPHMVVEIYGEYRDSMDVVKYCENDVIATKELFEYHDNLWKYTPKKVIFNEPATIVLWGDGTKTVVKCSPNDTYDREKGLALCYMKKLYGNDNKFHKIFSKWTKE